MKIAHQALCYLDGREKLKKNHFLPFLESDKVIGKHEQQSFLTKIILKFTGIVILIISIRSET